MDVAPQKNISGTPQLMFFSVFVLKIKNKQEKLSWNLFSPKTPVHMLQRPFFLILAHF